MYLPNYAKLQNQDLALKLIEEFPLALLISTSDGKIQTSYLPFILEKENEGLVLKTHLARANPHWRSLQEARVLVSFRGPDRYISPAIYVEPLNVPTWNYAVVQVQGVVEVCETKEQIEEILRSSVVQFESRNGTSWSYDLPESFRGSLLKAIVGLKISIESIEAKFKLSQNRREEDYGAVMNFLEKSSKEVDQEILRWMKLSTTEM